MVVEVVCVSNWAHAVLIVPRAGKHQVRICRDFKVEDNRCLEIDTRDTLDNIENGNRLFQFDLPAASLLMPTRESYLKDLIINSDRGQLRMFLGLPDASVVRQRFSDGVPTNIDGRYPDH